MRVGGGDVDDDMVRNVFITKYPAHLGGYVWIKHEIFDEKNDYKVPACLVNGAMRSCCEMIKQRKIMDALETRRGYGVSHRYFNFKPEE